MAKLTPLQKAKTCLDFVDQRLEVTAQQTIEIAELMIADIKHLTASHADVQSKEDLANYVQSMDQIQLNWINKLQEIILEQTNRDLNGQVIQSLNQFLNMLSESQTQRMDFPLPSVVGRQIGSEEDEDQYLNQEEIEVLLKSQKPQNDNEQIN